MATPLTGNSGSSGSSLERLSERLIGEHWNFYPTAGSRIGRHEFDGRLPDLTAGSISRRKREIQRGLSDVESLESAPLGDEEQLSRRMLELFLERELFTFEELRPLENNPMRQAGFLNVGNYVRRDYAPLEDRLRAASSALKQVPEFLSVLDASMRDDLSRHIVDMSVESYGGMAQFYRNELASFATKVDDRQIAADFASSVAEAAAALDGFVEKLKLRARAEDNDFAIGSALYARMLATGEGLDLPLERIASIGQANLEGESGAAKGGGRLHRPGQVRAADR